MNIEIRFYSKAGNTKKLADAIAQELSTVAKDITEGLPEDVDILFLGGALYAGNIDKELQKFINSLAANKVKKVIVFSTAAGPKSIQPKVKILLEDKNIIVSDEYFQCRGKFLLANKNSPNANDLDNVRAFAKKMIQGAS